MQFVRAAVIKKKKKKRGNSSALAKRKPPIAILFSAIDTFLLLLVSFDTPSHFLRNYIKNAVVLSFTREFLFIGARREKKRERERDS